MMFDEWRRKRDSPPPAPQKTVADVLNSYQGLCYLHVQDVALDSQDRFWLRRSATFEEGPRRLTQRTSDWVPVSSFSHGGKVHTNAHVNWGKLNMIPEPDPAEWARVYKISE